MRKHKTVVFVQGCFWHRHPGCRQASTPKTRTDFWQAKFKRNVERDKRNQSELRRLGWRVIVLWECEIKADPVETVLAAVREFDPQCEDRTTYAELPDSRQCLKVAEKKMHYMLMKPQP